MMNLGWLLRGWLANQARAHVYETVAREAQQRLRTGKTADEVAGEERDRTCDIGVAFALAIERGSFEDLLSGVVVTRGEGFRIAEGALDERRLAVAQSGTGRRAARRAAEALILGHRPRLVVAAGFAGGLAPELRRGDVLLATSVAAADAEPLAIKLNIAPEALAATPGVHVGRLITVDQVVCRPEAKRALGEQSGAVAVDMESWAVADVCRQSRTPFLAVRVISDAADEELPPEVQRMMQQRTTAGLLGAVAGSLARRPSSAKDMLRLKQEGLAAADRLAKFLKSMLAQIG